MPRILRRDNPRFLIPIVAGIGNALMTVPMVRQLKRGLPRCHITIAARIPAMGQVFNRLGEVDEVRLMRPGSAGMALSMLEAQAQRRPDIILTPFPSRRWQYTALALASGAAHRLLHAYPNGRNFIPADRVPAVRGIHDVVQNLNLLRPLGIEPDPAEPPRFPVNETDRQRARNLFLNAGLHGGSRPIAIHPGSAQTVLAKAKRWPPEMYAHLLLRLQREYGNRIVILEGPAEGGVGAEILYWAKPVKAPVLRLSGPLGDAAGVLERSMLYIGSDSGLAHLAAAVGTPPVTLFAPADPDRVCPFGYRHLVIQPKRRCVPCFMYPWESSSPKLKCADPRCIADISVDQVMETASRALASLPREMDE